MADKKTEHLENELSATSDIENFFDKNADAFKDYTLPEYLKRLLAEKNMTRADLHKATGIDKTYIYHICDGRKKPGRQKTLAIALALGLSAKETNYLLYYAGLPKLYVKNSWDSIIFYALEKHLTVMETNNLLDQLAETDMLG